MRCGGDDGSLLDDIASYRFQTLAGTLLYSRTDRNLPSGVDPLYVAGIDPVHGDNSGQLLTDGIARNFRDPNGPPWWTEYDIHYDVLHNFAFDEGTDGVGSFGNDYLAGGPGNDQIFGQLGHDVVQGDGGIEDAVGGVSHVGASRTSGGVVRSQRPADGGGELRGRHRRRGLRRGRRRKRRDHGRARPGRPGRRLLRPLQPESRRTTGPTATIICSAVRACRSTATTRTCRVTGP